MYCVLKIFISLLKILLTLLLGYTILGVLNLKTFNVIKDKLYTYLEITQHWFIGNVNVYPKSTYIEISEMSDSVESVIQVFKDEL